MQLRLPHCHAADAELLRAYHQPWDPLWGPGDWVELGRGAVLLAADGSPQHVELVLHGPGSVAVGRAVQAGGRDDWVYAVPTGAPGAQGVGLAVRARTVLGCQAPKMVNSDACPRPTTGAVGAERGLRAALRADGVPDNRDAGTAGAAAVAAGVAADVRAREGRQGGRGVGRRGRVAPAKVDTVILHCHCLSRIAIASGFTQQFCCHCCHFLSK